MNDFLLNIIAILNKQLSERQLKRDLKTFDNSMYVKVIAKLSKALANRQLKKDIKELNDLYIEIGADIKIDNNTKNKLQKRILELQNSISDIEIKTRVAKKNIGAEVESARRTGQTRANKTPINFNLEVKKNKAIADIEYLGKRFSKLFSNVSAKQKYNNLLNSAYSISDVSQLKSVRTQISAFTSELKANDLASKSLGDKWKALVERSKDLFSAASIVTVIFSQIKQSISTFLELDTAMTNLYKVQNDITSRDQFSGLLTKWNKLAQNLSITTKSLINSAEEWSKIGFDLDMSEQLAKITSIFEKTAEISNEKANSTLISVAQAFPEIDNFGEDDYVKRVEAIGNKINKVGNEFSISSEGVSDALQNSSAALRMANNDLDESIAIATTSNKIFQNPDEVGNMSKILSARLRGQKGELEELGLDTDGMIESVSKIQTQILNLTHNKVNIFEDDNETLKSTYQIMLEIGKVYDSLSDKDQAALLEIIGGKQRMSAVASLLLNYKELEKVKKASQSADNSMQEEYNKYLESAEAHITTFKEKVIETYSAFMSGDLIKHTADIGSAILDLVNSTDLLKHSLIAIATIKIGKGIATIGGAIGNAVKQMNTLGNAIQKIKDLPLDGVLRKNILNDIGESTQSLTEKNLKLLLSQKNLTEQDRIAILSKHGLTEEEAIAKLSKMNLTSATQANTVANAANTSSVNTLKGTFTSLTTSIKATWAAMSGLEKASVIFTVVSTTWSILSSVIDGHNQKIEEAKQKTQELADEVVEEEENLISLIEQYNELDKTDRSTENTERIKVLNDEINEALGTQAERIDIVNGKLDEQNEKIQRNLLQRLQEDKSKIDTAVSVAKGEYDEGLEQGFWGIDTSGKVGRALKKNGVPLGIATVSQVMKKLKPDQQIKELKIWLDLLTKADAGTGKYGDELSLIQSWYNEVTEKQKKYNEELDKQRKIEAQQKILNDSLSGKVKGEKAFKAYRDQIKETYKDNETLQNQMLDFANTTFPDYADKLEETTKKANKAKQSQSSSTSSRTFDEVWNDKDYKSTKTKLEKLAKSGKLTPETLKSIKEYKNMWEDTSLGAKEFITQIKQLLTMQDKLSMFSKDTKKVGSAYKDFKKNGFVSSSSLNNMPDSFKNLDGYTEFNKTVRNKKSSSSQKQSAFNDLVTEYLQEYKIFEGIYEKFKDLQGKIDNAKDNGDSKAVSKYTKQFEKQQKKFATSLRDAGVTNADELVKYFEESLYREEALTRKASSELSKLNAKDLENYVKVLNEKGKLSADSLSKIGSNMQSLVNILGKAYKDDLTNWMNALEEKRKAWNKLAGAVGGSTKAETKKNYKNLMKKDESELTAKDMGAYEYATKAGFSVDKKGNVQSKADKKEKEARKTVDFDLKKVKGKFKVNYHPNTSSGDGSSSSKGKSTKNTKTEINWLERALDVLQKKLDVTAAKLQNLFSVSSKNKNLKNQINYVEKQISAYDKVMQKYDQKMKQADKKNVFYKNEKKNDDIISKIKNGKLSGKNLDDLISTYGSKRGKKIKKYIEYYDNYLDAQKNKEDKKATKRELQQQQHQNYVDLYDSRVSRAETKESIAVGSKAKNTSVDTQIRNLKESYKYQIKIANLNKNKAEAERLEYELQKKITDLKVQQIDNIKADYENKIGLIDNDEQNINNQISKAEARGQILQSSFYNDLNKEEDKKLTKLEEELKKLDKQQNTFTKYSQEWYNLQSDIQSTKNAINEAEVAIIENNKKIGELREAMYDDIAARNSNVSTETSFLTGLLGDNLTDDKTGGLTKNGLAALGLYGIDMEANASTALSRKKEREEIEKAIESYNNGNANALDTYGSLNAAEKKLAEVIKEEQDAISAEYASEKQIYDLMVQRYEAQLSYLQSIINSRKKALDLEKDLYDYQKNIANQTKNIATLEKQLTALQGDDSEEGRARRSKIQLQLDEASQELESTEYERYISEQQNMLDNLYSQYEDLVKELEKDFDKVVSDGVKTINKTSKDILGAVNGIAQKYGYNPSEDTKKALNTYKNEDGTKVQTLPDKVANKVSSTVGKEFQNIETKVEDNYSSKKESSATSGKNNNVSNISSNNNLKEAEKHYRDRRDAQTVSADGITTTLAHFRNGASVNSERDRLKKLVVGKDYSMKADKSPEKYKSKLNQMLAEHTGYVIKSGDNYIQSFAMALGLKTATKGKNGSKFAKDGNVYQELKKRFANIGFRTGGIAKLIKPVGEDGIGWMRNGEGLIAPEHVESIKKLMNIVPDMTQFTNALTNVKPVNREFGNQTFGDINLQLDLPNVENAQDFVYALQTDTKVQKAFTIATKDLMSKGRITNNIQSIR